MKHLLVYLTLILTSACASTDNGGGDGYEFGDLSKSYCSSTDPEFRKTVKVLLTTAGINVGVDYCFTVGLVDAMMMLKKND